LQAKGTLYLVSTPIGNLEDVTLRAVRVLRDVGGIACEDTRRTRRLLEHHGVAARPTPFHKFNEHRVATSLLRRLAAGEDIALVTDSGTPSIADPGFSLVRAAVREGIRVVPVPGPSAVLAALVGSGLPAQPFLFLGFAPHRSGERSRWIASLRDRAETLVCFESPRRLAETLEAMARSWGDRPAAVAREMTKLHEEFHRGTIRDLAAAFRGREVRGEVTIVVAGAPEPGARAADAATLRREVLRMMRRGLSRRDAVRAVAAERRLPRQAVQRAAHGDGEPAGWDESE
jgi:16S rRNA (cytidine1402-2'-O)-methyltransferase